MPGGSFLSGFWDLKHIKELSVVNIYRDKIDEYGLSFYPDQESEVYYVDPSDRDRYIALDEYFNYMKAARITELQKLAQDLGAKHFRVTYKEQKKSLVSKNGKANLQVKGMKSVNGSAQADYDKAETSYSKIDIAAESDYLRLQGLKRVMLQKSMQRLMR